MDEGGFQDSSKFKLRGRFMHGGSLGLGLE
jgi:hypothetical protein